jgi:hypothetical protein
MKDSMKMTVKYQFLNMLLMHLGAAGVTFVFGMVAFWYFLSQPVWKEVLSVIFMAVYCSMLYLRAKKFAAIDNKPYTPLKPHMAKGFLFGLEISVVTFILLVLFKLMWTFFCVDGGVVGVIPTAINVIFYFWSFPYNGIMGLSEGLMTWYSEVLMLVLPIVFCTLGYVAGSKNIEIIEKFENYMYEDK